MPSGVVTVTSTVVPAVPAGLLTTTCESDLLRMVAATLPNITAVASEKFVPVIVMSLPPEAGPIPGLMPVTTGTDVYVNRSAAVVADAPPPVTTVTSTIPVVSAGLVATICVAVSLVIVPAVPPNFTAVAAARFVPAIVTDVPPAKGPTPGLMPVTAAWPRR